MTGTRGMHGPVVVKRTNSKPVFRQFLRTLRNKAVSCDTFSQQLSAPAKVPKTERIESLMLRYSSLSANGHARGTKDLTEGGGVLGRKSQANRTIQTGSQN
ncbi:hypothetical protein VTO42DRAFT_8865 [Malbranchea cinnamomea]